MHWIGKAQHHNQFAAGVDELPSLPQVLLEVMDACQAPSVDFDQLADSICKDPVLLLKIISIACSTRPVQTDQLQSFSQMLANLGTSTIRTIVITATVNYYFASSDEKNSRAQKRIWQDSLRCAYLTSELAEEAGYQNSTEAYCAGLLHNVGELMLLIGNPKEYAETYLSVSSEKELTLFEEEWFGANSCALGADTIQNLIADSFISDALLYQQEATSAITDTPQIVQFLNLAQKLCTPNLALESYAPAAQQQLGINSQQLLDAKERAEQKLANLYHQLGIHNTADLAHNINDMAVRNKLGGHIKGFATMFGLNQRQGVDTLQENAWYGVLRNFNILFGFSRAIAFQYKQESNLLQGIAGSGGDTAKLKQLSLQVSNGRSMVAECLLNAAPCYSETLEGKHAHSLTDQQLLRFLGSESFACIPLIDNGFRFGVIVVGMKRQQLLALSHQELLIEQFSKAASNNLAEQQQSALIFQQSLDTQRAQQVNGIRKLAHEAANPLGVISNYIQVLTKTLDSDETVNKQLNLIREELERVSSLIDKMKDVDVSVKFEEGLININQLIEDQVSIFRNSVFATNDISCDMALGDGIPLLKSHAPSVKQILTNLLKNAVEAMPHGGKVRVSSRGNVNFNGSLHVVLTIADTGTGITDQVMSQAFMPLNSTKGKDHTGLGLSIVSNLVANLNGHISCSNGINGGAEFTILLPC
ncbi:MAG: HDOD domain-containing protein [Motiliproteus sp.]|nr:HDOD domain-containing protein [Motiliproteus sp.]MCW9052082.1 HDOD domain-containing protein [Motiliproteus sp.]